MDRSTLPLAVRLHALDMAQVMVRDFDGTIRYWSAALTRLYGISPEQATGRRSHELLRTVFPRPLAEIETELRLRHQWTGELAHRHADGRTILVASHWSLGDGGGFPVVTEMITDLTDRKRDQEARFRLAAIVEGAEEAVVGKTLSGVITSWNRAAEAMFGYSAAEMLGESILRIIPRELHDEELGLLRRIATGESIRHHETRRYRKDQTMIDVALTISPIRDDGGRIIGASKIARDISEECRARERLAELQSELARLGRLTAMGEIAAVLSHELQQPVTALTNYSETLAQMLEAGRLDRESARRIVDKMGRQVVRTGEVIRRIRNFVANRETSRENVAVNHLVDEAVELARVGAGASGIRIAVALHPSAGQVNADRVQIEQVLVNLLRNAIDALQGASRREITVATKPDRDAGTVAITVEDTGPGIQPEIADRLFQPFVTSKQSGLGIGLSISRDIVTSHSGKIFAAARPGGGTRFSVVLPAYAHADIIGG